MLALTVFLAGAATQFFRVVSERDKTQQLLSQSAVSAGNLAMQRGQMEHAIEHFTQAIEEGYAEKTQLMLKIVESSIVARRLDDAVHWYKKVDTEITDKEQLAERALWKAELAFSGLSEFGDVLEQFSAASKHHLEEDDRHYVNGVLANASLAAVTEFQKAIDINPFHHRARRMLVFMQFSLGRFDEALDNCRIALQLFPNDIDFRILKGLAESALGEFESATSSFQQLDFDEQEKLKWISLAEMLDEVVNDERLLFKGVSQFDARTLASILSKFRTNEFDMLVNRKWRIPPKIAEAFSIVIDNIEPLSMEMTTRKDQTELRLLGELVEKHPEQALLLLHATQCEARVPKVPQDAATEIEYLELARESHRRALDAKGFVNKPNFSRKGIFATSIVLSNVYQHEVDANRLAAVSALRDISTEGETAERCRVYTIAAIQAKEIELAERWVTVWLNETSEPSVAHRNALWHRMIVRKRQEDWIRVKSDCEELQRSYPDYDATAAQLDYALRKLKAITSTE